MFCHVQVFYLIRFTPKRLKIENIKILIDLVIFLKKNLILFVEKCPKQTQMSRQHWAAEEAVEQELIQTSMTRILQHQDVAQEMETMEMATAVTVSGLNTN